MCPIVSLSSGLIRGCSGAALGCKTEENKTFLRIYGFEGEPGGRGRSRRASENQNVAGYEDAMFTANISSTHQKMIAQRFLQKDTL